MTIRTLPLRRLLVLPALALVLVGAPVLAIEDTPPPPPSTEDVPVAPEAEALSTGWQSEPTPVDAQLVGVKWDGDPEAEFAVEVQQTDGTWTTPTDLNGDDGPTQADEGTQDAVGAAADPANVTEPIWVGEDVVAVRVSLDEGDATNVSVVAVTSLSTGAPEGSAGALDSLVPGIDGPGRFAFAAALLVTAALLFAVALGWSPRRVGRRSRRVLAVLAGVALISACVPLRAPDWANGTWQPPITSRSSWGARPFGTGPAPCAAPEYAPKLKFAVVHHTVNSNNYSPGQSAALVRGIQAYHMDANGYCDIAYHFLIDKYGQIFEGRAGGIDRPVIGGHAGGFNTGSTGVALIGDYRTADVSSEQWNSLVHLLRWRFSVAGVDPGQPFTHTVGSSPCNCQRYPVGFTTWFANAIVTHNDVDFTECPATVSNLMAELRSQVQSGYIPPTTTTT